MKKKNVILIIVFAFVFALGVGGGVTAFLLNYNRTTPPLVEIFGLEDSIYAKTDSVGQYKGCRFKAENADETFFLESETNTVCLSGDERFTPGKKYLISVCYLGETEGGNSQYGDKQEWTAVSYLDVPRIVYDETTQIVSWNAVAGASSFMIYFGGQTQRIYL